MFSAIAVEFRCFVNSVRIKKTSVGEELLQAGFRHDIRLRGNQIWKSCSCLFQQVEAKPSVSVLAPPILVHGRVHLPLQVDCVVRRPSGPKAPGGVHVMWSLRKATHWWIHEWLVVLGPVVDHIQNVCPWAGELRKGLSVVEDELAKVSILVIAARVVVDVVGSIVATVRVSNLPK